MKLKLDEYNQQFVDLCENENFKDRLNEVKVFAKPMRTGKNYSECNHRIPYLIKKQDIKLHIATSPLNGIILENKEDLEDLCTDNGWKYESDPEAILRNIEKGYPTITYWTNSRCFTQVVTLDFFEELKKLNLLPKVSLNVDEFDTWTLSHYSKAADVKGYEMKNVEQYAAAMYSTTQTIAEHSPYTFGMTATASLEVKGTIDTHGILNYTLINPLVAGEQKQYANTVAHIGKSTFFNFEDNLEGKNEIEKTVREMLTSRFEIEKITRLKRVAMIQSGNDTQDEKGFGISPNPKEVIKYIGKNKDLLPHKEEVGFVLTSDKKYSFNINGDTVNNNLTESQIYKRIKDLSDPTRILIVKGMAGRGITLPPVKEIMTVKVRDAKSKYGSITESVEQFIGRGKSIYVGESQSKFWSKYESILNVPGYQELANTYNYYASNTPMYVNGDARHREYDACTLEMSDLQIELCEKCGQTLPHNISFNIDDDFSGLDNIFDIKKAG